MKKFYFTFGYAHGNSDKYQVIFAMTEPEAYSKMLEMHGNRWAFGYNQEQWCMTKNEGFFGNLKPLDPAYAFAS